MFCFFFVPYYLVLKKMYLTTTARKKKRKNYPPVLARRFLDVPAEHEAYRVAFSPPFEKLAQHQLSPSKTPAPPEDPRSGE